MKTSQAGVPLVSCYYDLASNYTTSPKQRYERFVVTPSGFVVASSALLNHSPPVYMCTATRENHGHVQAISIPTHKRNLPRSQNGYQPLCREWMEICFVCCNQEAVRIVEGVKGGGCGVWMADKWIKLPNSKHCQFLVLRAYLTKTAMFCKDLLPVFCS
jgi:hypothetical protein